MMRLSNPKNSWAGVALVERLAETETVTRMATKQMRLLSKHNQNKKLCVFDAGHGLDFRSPQRMSEHSSYPAG